MIRYRADRDDLRQRLEAAKPGWMARAKDRTAALIDVGCYYERSSIWSEVKTVWSKLQHNKCAFCERALATPDGGGLVEHDLEHFRPKSRVRAWPPAGEDPWPHETGDASDTGYYWLAYDPDNYAVSCKKCNEPLKSDYFPIRGARGVAPADSAQLDIDERPWLLRPVGDGPGNPNHELEFLGLNPRPREDATDPDAASLTIRFFQLDTREELLRARAEKLIALDNALHNLSLPARSAQAELDIRRMRQPSSEHSSCINAMIALFERDYASAYAIFDACRVYLDSLEGRRAP